ncbi:MAG: hypothetical protein QM731_27705 [Chitinophagaceae bacterium]
MPGIMVAFLLGIAFFLLLLVIAEKKRNKKRIEDLRKRWGKPRNEYFDFDKITAYSNLQKDTPFHRLTPQTLADIDLHEVFTVIDHTTSRVGQQYLFNTLCTPSGNLKQLQQTDAQVQFFTDNIQLRETVQTELLSLHDSKAYNIAHLQEGKLQQRPSWYLLAVLDTIAVIVMLVLSIWFPVLLIWLMLPLAVNLFLHFRNKNNTYRFIWSFPQLNILLNVSAKLCRMELPFEIEPVVKSIAALKTFQKRSSLLNFGQTGIMDDVSQAMMYVFEMVKAFFLVEFHAFFVVTKELENKQQEVNDVFRFVGEIDTAIAIASLRAGALATCRPQLIPAAKKFNIQKAIHPLIENCTPNDMMVHDKSVLITGSNMSGKTTFLRTLGINAILAQSIYTCFAESYRAPLLKLYSSIRIDDNLLDGKSYYFEEVNIMSTLISAAGMAEQHLFLLDEVFKGTNTIERIASAKAILSYLNRGNNLVFVATHDIELAEMLAEAYELYHFAEDIRDNELLFDHTIKPGPLRTRNAIRILEISNYPFSVTQEAKQISAQLQQQRKGESDTK